MEEVGIAEQEASPAPAPRPADTRSRDQSDGSAAGSSPFVYAIGRVEPRFPSLGIEKEFAQVASRSETTGLTDRQTVQVILSERENRYLARQVSWVFTIEGLETYLLVPRDPGDLDLLIEAARPQPLPTDIDVIVGVRSPNHPGMCNGLTVPVAIFDQIYSFDRDTFIKAIPRPEKTTDKEDAQFRATASELLDRIMQMADNTGATDRYRAMNYVAVRYPAIYAQASQAHAANASLAGVEARPSRLAGARNIVNIIFSYTHRQTDVTEKYFVRVDVTEEFPFLMMKLSPYYERE